MESMHIIACKKQSDSLIVCTSVFISSGGKIRKHEEDRLHSKDLPALKPSESAKNKQKKDDSIASTSPLYVFPLKKCDKYVQKYEVC